jgi:molybdate transport system substrate-binding protein
MSLHKGAVMKRIQKELLLMLVLPLFYHLFFSAPSRAAEIHVSAAASMTEAVKTIIAEYNKSYPNHQVRANFASSGSLAKQIIQGAPAEIYISANPKWMNHLIEQKLIAAESKRIFAYNSLVFISARKEKPTSVYDLITLERIAIGNPKSVPAGQYAKQAMSGAKIYLTLQESKKLIMAKDVRQALIYADRGEVDGAFVYKTDALLARHATISFSVPKELYTLITYPIGLTPAGKKSEAAKSLLQFMEGPAATAILKKYGFETIGY